jgi:hypothetical protein
MCLNSSSEWEFYNAFCFLGLPRDNNQMCLNLETWQATICILPVCEEFYLLGYNAM